MYIDCIGSAFNMKGAMQCPNCRKIEDGRWLYANGSSRSLPDFGIDEWTFSEEPYEYTFPEMVSTFTFSQSRKMPLMNNLWFGSCTILGPLSTALLVYQ